MSDDTAPQLQVQIDVNANTTGATQAADALNGVKASAGGAAEAAGQATGSMEKMGQGAMGAGHLLHGLEMAGHGSMRGLFAAANGAKHLLETLGMGALGGMAVFAFGLGAAVMGLMKLFGDSQKEAGELQKKAEELVESTKKLRDLRMDQVVEQYTRMRDAVAGVGKAQDALNESRLKMKEAKLQTALAQSELDEAKEMAALRPGDETGRKRVTLKYAAQRETMEADSAVEIAKDRQHNIRDKQANLEKQAEQEAKALETAEKNLQAGETELAHRKKNNATLQAMGDQLREVQYKLFHQAPEASDPYQTKLHAQEVDLIRRISEGKDIMKARPVEESVAKVKGLKEKQEEQKKIYEKLETEYAATQSESDLAAEDLRKKQTKSQIVPISVSTKERDLAYEEKQRADKAARERKLADLERQKDAIEAKEHADKEHLLHAKHGEDPDEIANLHAAAAGAKINLTQSTQDLIQTLIRATEEDARQKQALIDQIKDLRAKQDNTITN